MSAALHDLGVAELLRAFDSKQVSSVEATKHLLSRATAHQHLGAWLCMDADAALAQARNADAMRAQGGTAPLLGVPLAHKDIFVTRDLPTTAGSKMLANYRSPFDATVVARLAAAGTVTLGKLSCDEFAMGSGNENSAFGPVKNPWDLARVPGGSSGGSAAAVAARLVPAATGTDTGGSIRVPAAFCGLYGFRLIPHHRWVADAVMLAPSFDTPGFFTSTAADMGATLDALVPVEAGNPKAHSPNPNGSRAPRGAYLPLPGLDPEVEIAFTTAASRFAEPLAPALAAELASLFAPAAELYAVIGGRETWAIHAPWFEHYRDRYDPGVRARIERASTITAAQLAPALAHRIKIRAAWAALFRDYDFVVLPSSPCPALTKADCTLANRNRILSLTAPASMADLPVLALPVQLPDTGGLTTGLQVIAPTVSSPAFRHALALHG
jgi:Asp-tRNA(Asn)/Glu-tRNA(Gln) amidotransferase A subunit family amidase